MHSGSEHQTQNNRVELIRFVLEESEKQPLTRRVKLYRGLASICGDEQENANLNALAEILERAETACAQFVFDFNHPKAKPAMKTSR